MATQMAVTPVVKGEQAKVILKEAKEYTSEKSKENAKKLIDYFSKMMK